MQVGPEDSIIEGDVADVGHIGEEEVDVELTHRVGPPAEKVKHLLPGFDKVGIEGVSGGRGGGVERGHSTGERHFNGGVKVALGEDRIDVGHGRDKVRREVVGVGEDLIADSDGKDSDDRIAGGVVGLDRFLRSGGIGGDVGKELVGDGDDARDVGTDEDGGLVVEELDMVEGLGFEELHNIGGWWEVVCHSAIVHTYETGVCLHACIKRR